VKKAKQRAASWRELYGIEEDLGRLSQLLDNPDPDDLRVVRVAIGCLLTQMRKALTDLGNAI
jgi:hypothetical protein